MDEKEAEARPVMGTIFLVIVSLSKTSPCTDGAFLIQLGVPLILFILEPGI